MLFKVEGHEELVKDKRTGAILLNDIRVVDDYKAKKALLTSNRALSTEINTIKEKMKEIENVREELASIRELLQRIADK